jgi:hypothetical protein
MPSTVRNSNNVTNWQQNTKVNGKIFVRFVKKAKKGQSFFLLKNFCMIDFVILAILQQELLKYLKGLSNEN